MKNEISVFSKLPCTPKYDIAIGTHSGIFHADEVVAVSLLSIYFSPARIAVIRTRNNDELRKCNVLVDIGSGRFDHHQIGGNGKRKNGVFYASAGLVWKEFGKEIISNLAGLSGKYFDGFPTSMIFEKFDSVYIQPVDNIDNGVPEDSCKFDYITSFLPSWNKSTEDDFNDAFYEVITVTTSILKALLKKMIEHQYSYSWAIKALDASKDSIFEIPTQTFPWLRPVTDYNLFSYNVANFVIFPYPAGGWAAQCVPPSFEEPFKQRIPFPKSWAGQTTNLPKISGIDEATFCHNNLFFARANTKEAVIQMCQKAIESFNK